jgi:3-hydroxy acid dehydrogenase/malonic semialdehyde reductase
VTRPPRTLLVTGASRGIGRALADRLLARGDRVVALARGFDADWQHPDLAAVTVDLADLATLPERLRAVAREHGDIDGLVCNAGRGVFGSLEEFSPRQVGELVDLNLTSQLLLVREFLPAFKRRRRGDIGLMGSESALSGGRRGVVYCATKFALRGAAQALREECAASGVRVGVVNPGMVDTDFYSGVHFRPGRLPENHLRADDVADAVLLMLDARPGAAIDEINLSPQKRVIEFRK